MPLVRAMTRTREFANSGLTTEHFPENPNGSITINALDVAGAFHHCLEEVDGVPSVSELLMSITMECRDQAAIVTAFTGQTTLVNDGQLVEEFDPDGVGALTIGRPDLKDVINETIQGANDPSVSSVLLRLSLEWSIEAA